MKKIRSILKSTRGDIMIEASGLLLLVVMVLALALHTFPAFIAKQQLDTYASELCRTAELAGEVGAETSEKEQSLSEQTGLHPDVTWSKTGKIQLDEKITLKCTIVKDIGFANFGSFPVTLKAIQEGRSEVYWK